MSAEHAGLASSTSPPTVQDGGVYEPPAVRLDLHSYFLGLKGRGLWGKGKQNGMERQATVLKPGAST